MSIRSVRFLLVAVLLGLAGAGSPPPATGQTLDDVTRYSERVPAPGGYSVGMAGAGLFSGVDAPTALFGNPAGLGWLSGSAIGGDFSVLRARSTAQFSTPDATRTVDRTVSDYSLGSLAGAYSFPTDRGSLVLGVSLHQTNGYGRGFDVTGANRTNSITGTFLPSGYSVDEEGPLFESARSELAYESGAIDFSRAVFENGNYPFFPAADPRSAAVDGQMTLEQQENILESGQMNELATGVAIEVAPGVMLGGGLNVAFGTYTFERFYRERDASALLPPEDLSNPQPPYDPYFLAGTSLEGFYEYRLEERIETDISGVNLRFGLSAQVTEALRGGLLVETPTWYNLTEVFGTEMQTDFDCDFSRSGEVCPPGGVEGFASGDLTGSEFTYRLRTPWRIGGGLQYARAGLTLAGDLEFVDWTQARVSADDASFTTLNRRIRDLDATVNAQVGAEYSFGATAVRTGVAYRPDPRDPSFEDVDGETTDNDRLFLSAGLSYAPTDQFSLHASWTQERFDDSFPSYVDGPVVREEVARNRVLLGLTYRP
jgi:opacity protein-like surface antigen